MERTSLINRGDRGHQVSQDRRGSLHNVGDRVQISRNKSSEDSVDTEAHWPSWISERRHFTSSLLFTTTIAHGETGSLTLESKERSTKRVYLSIKSNPRRARIIDLAAFEKQSSCRAEKMPYLLQLFLQTHIFSMVADKKLIIVVVPRTIHLLRR